MARHFKESTKSIPVVTLTTDPVALGLTTSLSRPESNLTGVIADAGIQIWEKRFELLRQAFGSMPRVGFVVSKYSWKGHTVVRSEKSVQDTCRAYRAGVTARGFSPMSANQ
jgi:putative ABC transport system substrate-binding protein